MTNSLCTCASQKENPLCKSTCVNTNGNYRCECSNGYYLLNKGICIGKSICYGIHCLKKSWIWENTARKNLRIWTLFKQWFVFLHDRIGVLLVSLVQALNIFHTLFWCFFCWIWAGKCWLWCKTPHSTRVRDNTEKKNFLFGRIWHKCIHWLLFLNCQKYSKKLSYIYLQQCSHGLTSQIAL